MKLKMVKAKFYQDGKFPDEITFGTSGYRGVVGDDFTKDGIVVATNAIADYLEQAKPGDARGVIVGYDTRFLSKECAEIAAQMLAERDITVHLCERSTPTPVISFIIREWCLQGSINFTASHNPPADNGLKFNPSWGGVAEKSVTDLIQQQIQAILEGGAAYQHPTVSLEQLVCQGKIEMIDPTEKYLAALLDRHFAHVRGQGRIVVDFLWGSAYGYLDAALERLGFDVYRLHDVREESPPAFRDLDEDIETARFSDIPLDTQLNKRRMDPTNPDVLVRLSEEVVDRGAVLGLAVDPDGDRFGIVDSDGTLFLPNQIIPTLLGYLIRSRSWKTGVARTVATSHWIDAVARQHNMSCHETPVGFKFLGPFLEEKAADLGAEESGGLSICDWVMDKDGILACLLAAEMRIKEKKSLAAIFTEMTRKYRRYYSEREDLPATDDFKAKVESMTQQKPQQLGRFQATRVVTELPDVPVSRNPKDGTWIRETVPIGGIKWLFDDGWVLLRPSGTESIIKLYAESHTSQEHLRQLMTEAKALLGL